MMLKTTKIQTFLTDRRTMLGLWLLIALCSALSKMSASAHNNFLIFRGVFWHTWNQTSLFGYYPAEYADCNHYGPLFSVIIAPFALLPEHLGLILWNVSLALLLYWAINKLRLSRYQFVFMIWFCAHELLTALFMQQFNVATVAMIMLTYAFVRDERDVWATLMIVIGMFVKIYGVVGLTFFLFSKHKLKFIGWGLLWCVVMFCLPMLISSPEYIVSQYGEWFTALVHKNSGNELSLMQNISLLGMIRKIGYACAMGMADLWAVMRYESVPSETIWATYNDLFVILPGLILFALCCFLRMSQWKNEAYRLSLLASLLMFVCLFSTGTESSSYIIAFVGVVLWFTVAPWHRNYWDIALMIFAFILTSLSPSDLFPAYLRREWIQPLALKALPVALIWLQLSLELLTKDYKTES